MKRVILLILLVVLAFITNSCGQSSSRKRHAHKARNYQVEKAADRSISEQVKSSLKNYYNLSAKARHTAKVTTDEGRVTIKGLVMSHKERAIVLSLIKQIPGVSDVQDELEIHNES